jgi:hypothetical protein|tara:strand:+ start:9956 stop:10297 length:342 start_codon:yes stop_codon:yes gene_type:complete
MAISFPEVRSEQIPVTDTLQYSVETGTTAEVTSCTITNESAAAVSYSFYIPNPDASAGATNVLIDTKTVLAGQTDLMTELLGKRFSAGTTFRTTASDGSSLNMHLSLFVRTGS